MDNSSSQQKNKQAKKKKQGVSLDGGDLSAACSLGLSRALSGSLGLPIGSASGCSPSPPAARRGASGGCAQEQCVSVVRWCGSLEILKRRHFFSFLRNCRRVWKPVGRITRLLASKTRARLRNGAAQSAPGGKIVFTQPHKLRKTSPKTVYSQVSKNPASCCGLAVVFSASKKNYIWFYSISRKLNKIKDTKNVHVFLHFNRINPVINPPNQRHQSL